jgi:hypothetical protein
VIEDNQLENGDGDSPAMTPAARQPLRVRGHIVVDPEEELIVADRPADPPPAPAAIPDPPAAAAPDDLS